MNFHDNSTTYCGATRNDVASIPMVSSLQATDCYIRTVEFESGEGSILVDFYASDGHATGSYRGPIETCIRFPDVDSAEAFARTLFNKCEDARSRGLTSVPTDNFDRPILTQTIDTPSAFHADNIMCRNANGQEIRLQEMLDSMVDGLNVLRGLLLPIARIWSDAEVIALVTPPEDETEKSGE